MGSCPGLLLGPQGPLPHSLQCPVCLPGNLSFLPAVPLGSKGVLRNLRKHLRLEGSRQRTIKGFWHLPGPYCFKASTVNATGTCGPTLFPGCFHVLHHLTFSIPGGKGLPLAQVGRLRL